jgi:outer membrane PBP1 activator LpoA protein
MKRIIVPVLAALLLGGCVSNPLVPQRPQPQISNNAEIQRANSLLKQGQELEAAETYYRVAMKSPSPQRERLMLQAAEIATYIKDTSLARRYLSIIGGAPLSANNQARRNYVKASIALLEDNPDFALKLLPKQKGTLPNELWSKINRVRQQALTLGGKNNTSTATQPSANQSGGALPQTVNRVAVLLPLSGKLSVLGKTILQGVQATQAGFASDTRVQTYDVASNDVVAQYQKAVADGADVVIGPLDKRKLEALTQQGNLPRPVIGLNKLAQQGTRYATIFQFGLAPEDEAYQVAQFAASRNQRRAAMLYPDSVWGRRLAQAFKNGYSRSGGQIIVEEAYPNTAASYAQSVQRVLSQGQVDMVFLAASPTQARLIRPMIQHKGGANIPVYATSHIYTGSPDPGKNADLNGIVYTEIPYILETSVPGTSLIEGKYPRLHAMGADALVIAKNIAQMAGSRQPIKGKTGVISIDGKNVLHRKLDLATFVNGSVVPLGQ